ncbi:right-handed parallel beta-helix repeat-containing protein [Breznakibacter xylanolyticus]|nr:right-handed parallel beta-helix repeat-containing protein [Breznakibacter xylanolyticus]
MRKILLMALLATTAHLMAKETTVTTADELKSAISNANAGDIIWVAAGTYAFTTVPGIAISRSGTSTNPITLKAIEGARPVIDFSGQARNNSSAQGMKLTASYWYIKGLDIYKAGDNGLQIAGGHYNTIEFCNFYECNDSGLQIDNGATNNLILNCDYYFNADATKENADGFACKLSVGNNNKFKGCRSWRNLDDGWDGYLRNTDNITTYYEDCWTFQNGYDKDGVAGSGDGNGF